MLLQRWDPLFDFMRRHYTTDRFVRGFRQAVNGGETKRWSIAVDAVEEDDKLVVRASLPGTLRRRLKYSSRPACSPLTVRPRSMRKER